MNVNPFSYLIEKLKSKVDTAGTGLIKSGTTISTFVPRVAQSANTKPGQNSFDINEYNASSADLPDSNFYHILTAEGPDDAYLTQIALGMTANKMFYRRCNANTWGPWEELAFKSDTITRVEGLTINNGSSGGYFAGWTTPTGYKPVSFVVDWDSLALSEATNGISFYLGYQDAGNMCFIFSNQQLNTSVNFRVTYMKV